MLGQPMYLPRPQVVGVRVDGRAARPARRRPTWCSPSRRCCASTASWGSSSSSSATGCPRLELADRATLSNMCPEYGATAALLPGGRRDAALPARSRAAATGSTSSSATPRSRGCSGATATPSPVFTRCWSSISPRSSRRSPGRSARRTASRCRRCGQRSSRPSATGSSPIRRRTRSRFVDEGGGHGRATRRRPAPRSRRDRAIAERGPVRHGSVVIAAITSCTNTSNPSVMLAAGLLAKKAVEAGLETKPWVKTVLAPGSRVVTDYLEEAGLTPYLDKLGFSLVGYGCTTCIGNSGPLPGRRRRRPSTRAIWPSSAVLSGNRNFEGRIHPQVRASYLASPPLVVAYALAGHVDIDLTHRAARAGADGARLPARHLAERRRRSVEVIAERRSRRSSSSASTRGSSTATSTGTRSRSPERSRLRVGPGLDVHPGAAVLRRTRPTRRPVGGHRRRAGAWSRWATRSRPTTSRRRARSSRTRPPAST